MTEGPAVPRPAATVMLLRDGGAGLEVLLLRRAATLAFVPGAHVFPGGAVEPSDAEPIAATGPSDEVASRRLSVGAHGFSFWVAAVRECLEEAGVFLARDERNRLLDADHRVFDELDAIRHDVEHGHRRFHDVLDEHRLRLDTASVRYLSRWITPEESPKRYDTRFFAVPMPPGQAAVPDDREAVDARWWTPGDALDACDAGEIVLIAPTVASLQLLRDHASCTSALHALDYGQTRTERIVEPAGGMRIPLPSDHPEVERP